MPISLTQITDWLTNLRQVFEPNARRSAADIAKSNALYHEALKDLEPRFLAAAFNSWMKTGDRFPLPAQLRKIAVEFAEGADAKAETTRRALSHGGVDGSVLRNEAIQLLGDFDLVMRRTLDASSVEYRNLIAECAAWWQTCRPQGGLDELAKQRQRMKVGRALEDFARAKLGLPPLPPIEPFGAGWTPPPQRPRGGEPRPVLEVLQPSPIEQAAAE
jgi:hypothetical protein